MIRVAAILMILVVGCLLSLGIVILYSASTQEGSQYVNKQLVGLVLGLGVCLLMGALDYRHLKKFSIVVYFLAVGLLILVFVPGIGLKINGAHRWIDLGVYHFQPSEFAKLALIVGLAHYIDRYQRSMSTFIRGLLIPGAFAGVIIGLVFVEPDRGTAILMSGVVCAMLLVGGIKWGHFLPPVILLVCLLVVSLANDPMRQKRIMSWLSLEETKLGTGYQTYQSMLAIGAGGVTGTGLGDGRRKFGTVPESHTDFIFSVIGEELGLVGGMAVVSLLALLVICGTLIAQSARDLFGTMLAIGVSYLLGMQSLINLGVVTSALPNKGLPLPFISYGGSSLLIMLSCIGILLSIARYSTFEEVGDNAFRKTGSRKLKTARAT